MILAKAPVYKFRLGRPSVTSGSDPRGTRNADSDGRPKQSRTSEDESERRGIEAGVRLDVDKHAGGP